MKKLFLIKTIYFLLGGLMVSVISVTAYSFLSSDISYKPANSNWNVNNVESALNNLRDQSIYFKNLNQTTTFSATDLISGKKAYTSGGTLITGTNSPNCVSGTMITTNECSGESGCVLFGGFNPSIFFVYIHSDDILNFYDNSISTTQYSRLEKGSPKTYEFLSNFYKYENGNFMLYNWGSHFVSKKITFTACK